MADNSAAIHDAALIATTLPLVPGLPARLAAGIDVADIGCGSGHAVNLMAQAFPHSRFVGYDFAADGTRAGRDEAQRLGLTNARFAARDLTRLEARAQFDLITALRDP
jgi:tRNA G46 methylase TrmB